MAQVFIQMEDALQCNQLHKNTVKHNSHYQNLQIKIIQSRKNEKWYLGQTLDAEARLRR